MGSLLAYVNANVIKLDAYTFGTSVLDGAGEKVAAIFIARKTGNISEVHSFASSVTTAGGNPVYDVRIETVDTSNGQPSGTLFGTNTNGTLTVSATGEQITTLTAAAAVTEGDLYAVVIAATTVGGTQTATFHRSTAGTVASFPYALTNTTGSFAKSGPAAGVVPFYDDGTVEAGGLMVSSATVTETFNSGSTPDERGNLWNFADSVDVCGAYGSFESNAAGANFSIVLYNSGGSALITRTIDGDCVRSVGTDGYFEIRWTPQTISASANFRLVIKPTTANNARLGVRTFSSSAIRAEHWPNGQYTSQTDAGGFSETATKCAMIAPMISAFNSAAGGGSCRVIGG